jgi:hypothetical protein
MCSSNLGYFFCFNSLILFNSVFKRVLKEIAKISFVMSLRQLVLDRLIRGRLSQYFLFAVLTRCLFFENAEQITLYMKT